MSLHQSNDFFSFWTRQNSFFLHFKIVRGVVGVRDRADETSSSDCHKITALRWKRFLPESKIGAGMQNTWRSLVRKRNNRNPLDFFISAAFGGIKTQAAVNQLKCCSCGQIKAAAELLNKLYLRSMHEKCWRFNNLNITILSFSMSFHKVASPMRLHTEELQYNALLWFLKATQSHGAEVRH